MFRSPSRRGALRCFLVTRANGLTLQPSGAAWRRHRLRNRLRCRSRALSRTESRISAAASNPLENDPSGTGKRASAPTRAVSWSCLSPQCGGDAPPDTQGPRGPGGDARCLVPDTRESGPFSATAFALRGPSLSTERQLQTLSHLIFYDVLTERRLPYA